MQVELSIVTVNYNCSLSLAKTLLALKPYARNPSVELVLVDGGSTDGSRDLIRDYSCEIARSICEKDSGIYDAMNKGIRLSRGKWIWFVNAGDIPAIGPDEILTIIRHSQCLNANYIYSDLLIGDRIIKQKLTLQLLAYSTVNHQNTLYRRELIAGGFDSRYRFCADYKHLLAVYDKLKPLKSSIPVCSYDFNGTSSLRSRSRRIAVWKERIRAQIESPINVIVKISFVLISILAIMAKVIHPGIGRTRVEARDNPSA